MFAKAAASPSVSLFLNVQSTHTLTRTQHARVSEKAKFIGRHRVITLAAHNASKLAGELYSVEKCNKSTQTRIGGLNLSGGARAPAINRLLCVCARERERAINQAAAQTRRRHWCTWPGANRTQTHTVCRPLTAFAPLSQTENHQPLPLFTLYVLRTQVQKPTELLLYGVAKCRLPFCRNLTSQRNQRTGFNFNKII